MRHIIIAILIVVTILALGIYEQYLIEDVMQYIGTRADDIAEYLKSGNKTRALNECRELISYWESHRRALESFFLHTELRDMPVSLAELYSAIEVDSIEDAIVCAHKVSASSHEHMHSLSFEYQNIL